MDLLNDIKEILKDDDEHHLRVEVSWEGITVYLEYDPEYDPAFNFEDDCIIPIHYTAIEEFCYIPHDEYCKIYKPSDYGIDLTEIKIVSKIMQYLDNHKKEINKLCKGYCIEDRDPYKEKHYEQ